MDKTQRRKTVLFEEQIQAFKSFWSTQTSEMPTAPTFKDQVYIKSTKKKILTEYSARWLVFNYPMLYLSEVTKKGKTCHSLNLELVPCKLYDYNLNAKSKYPHKLVLLHHNMSFEFYFQERSQLDTWIFRLREICLMCDFTSMYNMGNLLSKTGLSKVFWTQDKQSGKTYMAKVYNLQDDTNIEDDLQAKIEKQVITNEIRALRAISHPNIIKLKEVHEFQGRIVMVQEFIGGSSLLKHILSQGCLPEVETIHIMKTLLNVLKALHDKNILHRNLKPENILFDHTTGGKQLKLTSFGFSCILDPSQQSNWFVGRNICIKCGTPGYMAPELLSNKQSNFAGDIFSMGVILYTCLMGEPMFKGQNAEDIIYKNLNVSFAKTKKWHTLSENAKDLIIKMVQGNPKERPSIDAILRHPFFKNNELTPHVYGTQYLKSTWHSSGGCDFQSKSRRSSLEESLARQESGSKVPVDKALESLIVSPTYYDFTNSDDPEVPEFYIEGIGGDADMLDSEDSRGGQNNLKPEKKLRLELLKGSLSQIDYGEKTPNFKLKSPETFYEENIVEDEDYITPETDDSQLAKNYKKCYSFPILQHTPFTSQKPFVREFKTMTFKIESDLTDTLMTARKLPELQAPARQKLGAELRMLNDTHQKVAKSEI